MRERYQPATGISEESRRLVWEDNKQYNREKTATNVLCRQCTHTNCPKHQRPGKYLHSGFKTNYGEIEKHEILKFRLANGEIEGMELAITI